MAFSHPEYLVETDWLEDHLEDPDLRILDCTVYLTNYFDESAERRVNVVSGREHWREGHIPGSDFADLTGELRDPDNSHFMFPMPTAERFAEAMSRLGVGEGTRVVLYDDSAHMWAARVWWMLRAYGFDAAAVLNGGWRKWTREERPVTTAPPDHPPASFVPRPRPELIADKEEVRAAIERPSVCLVNALAPDEFAGRGPVRYSRPGRIPSSVNVPALQLIDPETHAYLPADELQRKFEAAGADNAERVITYCGGAIAASSDAFVLKLLGWDDVALYDGSLTEWSADPELPMDTGDA